MQKEDYVYILMFWVYKYYLNKFMTICLEALDTSPPYYCL